MQDEKIIIGLPSKGRLKLETEKLFHKIGLSANIGSNERSYRNKLKNFPDVEIFYLQPVEIPLQLRLGSIHLGITGEDLLREKIQILDKSVKILQKYNYGFAKLVVSVPKGWIDVDYMSDLEEVCNFFRKKNNRRLRVATKYPDLTRNFFSRFGIIHYITVETLGATEGAPFNGLSEIIVDITSSGKTLEDNDMKVLKDGLIMSSSACLIQSKKAKVSKSKKKILSKILGKLKS